MPTSDLALDPSFAESERAIAEQQARKQLVIGAVTFVLVSVAAGLILAFGLVEAGASMWILSLLNVVVDFRRWRFFRRAKAMDAFRELQSPDEKFPVIGEEKLLF